MRWFLKAFLGPLIGVFGVAVGGWLVSLAVFSFLDVAEVTEGATIQVLQLPARVPELVDLAIQLMQRELAGG